ncbi:hypothetical protein VT84_04980 [Gemmata sp. SH-PL17]|uniref:hypothetical protein n=1 Tax=Gemmata sp. SH-PL17 TaxID=1630693 RepID=UPI00078DBD70|nr:hypothetical protein [Gemmata sp. SH-PL17]AMV23744.1 hypothetical protein VT84_04980 [Gemmata sp. SH-PL17]
MFRTILPSALFALLTIGSTPVGAEDKKDKPRADPPATPLELSITGTTKYTFDGRNADELKNLIESAAKTGKRPPAAPAVDLSIEIKNTSDKPVAVWVAGDPVVLTCTLQGKGALNVAPPLAFTKEFRGPKSVEIAAGKTHTIPVKTLVSGYRGAAHWAYWLEAGEYELTATLKTGANPAPKGAKDANDGFGVVTLTSAPLKITVEAKK